MYSRSNFNNNDKKIDIYRNQIDRYIKLLKNVRSAKQIPQFNNKIRKHENEDINKKKDLNYINVRQLKGNQSYLTKLKQQDSVKNKSNYLYLRHEPRSSIHSMTTPFKPCQKPQSPTSLNLLPSLPSIPQYIKIRTKTQPTQTIQSRIELKKLSRTGSGNLLQFCRKKPTDRYFSQMENVRIAEKLLMIKPSKELKKTQHIKFFHQQSKYKNKISYSRLQAKTHKRSRHLSDWVN